ncbi:MAG: iron ABC transporter permease [Verrucomicrobiales bacterium]
MSRPVTIVRRLHPLAGSAWWIGATLIALLIAVPLAVVVVTLFDAPSDAWREVVGYGVLGTYVQGTVIMLLGTGLLASVFGIGAAWTVTVWEFPGRRFFSLALMFPMAIPTYVAAYSYDFAKHELRDPLMLWVRERFGAEAMSDANGIFNYVLATFVMALVLYPYVYIAARVGFAEISGTYIENSRLLGRSLWRSLFSVGLPLARPAIIGGLLLVLLEVMNEYGAMLHYGIETLTIGIFNQWYNWKDTDSAIRLAGVAMLVVFAIIIAEMILRGRSRFHAHHGARRNLAERPKTAFGTSIAFGFCSSLLFFAFLLPLWQLLKLAWHGIEKVQIGELLHPVFGSLSMAVLASLVILTAALFLAYAARIFPGLAMRLLSKMCMLGYALPGAVVVIAMLASVAALSRMVAADELTAILFTATPIGLVMAYAVRFMTPALAPLEAGMAGIHHSMDEASRILGRSSWGSFFRIHLPLLRLPLLGALIVLFVDILKELPLTLVLSPPNVETLATQTFGLMHKEERLAEGSLPALILVLSGCVGVFILHRLIRRSQTV